MINFVDIPIIVVNLPHRQDRSVWVKKHFADNKIIGYVFFEATYSTNGVVGLLNTMLSLMKSLDDNKYPNVLIFEDDAEFLTKFPDRDIKRALNELPDDFDALYLGCNLEKPDSEPHSKNLIKVKSAKAAHGVVYSAGAIRKVYQELLSMKTVIPYDDLLINILQKDGNSYASKKLIVGQKEMYSDIENRNVSYNAMLKRRFTQNTKHIK